MAAGLLLLVLVGLGAAAWLRWAGAADGARDWAKDALARLYPSRPSSRRALPRRLLRAAEQTLTVGVSGTVLVPTRIEIRVNPADLEPLAGAAEWLSHDIADALRKKAADRGWVVPDGPHILVIPDPDRPLRVPRAAGRIGALSAHDVATLRRAAAAAGPRHPGADARARGADPDRLDTRGTGDPWDPAGTAGPPTASTAFAPTVRAHHLRLVAEDDIDGDVSALVTSLQAPLVLGRSRQADLRVKDPQASGRHCSFALGADHGLVVEDLGSTNGTYVGALRVGRQPLHHGDTLRVGALSWQVELSDVAPPHHPEVPRR